MKFAKKDDKGNVVGHFEATDQDVQAQKIWTHKVRGDDKAKESEAASIQPPQDMSLLTVEKSARDEFGLHDLYVFGTDEIKYVDAEDEEDKTPRVGHADKVKVTPVKPRESTPPTPV